MNCASAKILHYWEISRQLAETVYNSYLALMTIRVCLHDTIFN